MKNTFLKRFLSVFLSFALMAGILLPISNFKVKADKPLDQVDSDGLAIETETKGGELKLSKKLSTDGKKITLEAYTTGAVRTENKSVPLDIVLVIDQSGSMEYDFKGLEKTTRQKAMKKAVAGFIDAVNEKYSDKADHRISLVEFRSEAKYLAPWTSVNTEGANTLKGKINKLDAEGATRVDLGMKKAEDLMGKDYNYKGANIAREKVVIVFTDGVPTKTNEFSTDVANAAIASAKNLKDAGATIYTIGIFDGADSDELYGKTGHKENSNGTVGSFWKDKWGLLSGGDVTKADIPAGNRFLNYLSSNYNNSNEIGLSRRDKDYWVSETVEFKITKNFARTAPKGENYYLTAKDSEGLGKIFQEISNTITEPTINLDKETVIKDIMSDNFKLPAGTKENDIIIKTAAKKGDGTFDIPHAENGLTVDLGKDENGNDVVSVKGFDFNKNTVTSEKKADGKYGKKLIIEIPVEYIEGSKGTDGEVYSNGINSGVYPEGSDKPILEFGQPKAKITKPKYTVKWLDENGNEITESTRENVIYKDSYEFKGTEPTKAEDNKNTYDWNWNSDRTVDFATQTITYTGAFAKTAKLYKVMWLDENNKEIPESTITDVEYQDSYEFTGKVPTKAADNENTYKWNWNSGRDVDLDAKTITYTGAFAETAIEYVIAYKDGVDGKVFKNQEYSAHYGDTTPTIDNPTRPDYVFVGWIDAETEDVIENLSETTVTKNVTYTATWADDKNNNGIPDDQEVIIDDETPLAPIDPPVEEPAEKPATKPAAKPAEPEKVVIDDETPLGNAPHTNDATDIVSAVAGVAVTGAACLFVMKKRKEEN